MPFFVCDFACLSVRLRRQCQRQRDAAKMQNNSLAQAKPAFLKKEKQEQTLRAHFRSGRTENAQALLNSQLVNQGVIYFLSLVATCLGSMPLRTGRSSRLGLVGNCARITACWPGLSELKLRYSRLIFPCRIIS